MANAIAVTAYRLEYNPVTALNYVALAYPTSLKQELVQNLFPVNVLQGSDTPGVPYLYCKVVLKAPGLGQEFYVMNSVQDIQNKLNS